MLTLRSNLRDTRIMPVKLLLAAVISALGLSYCLVPSDAQLRERLTKDHILSDLRSLIDSGSFGDRDSAQHLFAQMSAEQLTFISQLSRRTAPERLRQIFNPSRPLRYDRFIHYYTLAAVQYIDVIPPDAAFAIIEPQAQQIPAPQRTELILLLARNAIANQQHSVAIHILTTASTSGPSDWQTISTLIDAQNQSNQPTAALRSLQQWLAINQANIPAATRAQARQKLSHLALAANLPSQALPPLLAELQALPPHAPIPTDLLEQAHQTAQYAGQTAAILPWIERHLTSYPENQLPWSTLLAQTQSSREAEGQKGRGAEQQKGRGAAAQSNKETSKNLTAQSTSPATTPPHPANPVHPVQIPTTASPPPHPANPVNPVQNPPTSAPQTPYLLWTQRAAQAADWNALPTPAAHHHLRLIALGQLDSLHRYLPLATYLGLDQQTATLLAALGPIPGHPTLARTLAQLTASNGDSAQALKLYTAWLADHPTDHRAAQDHASLLEALSPPATAIAAYDHLLAAHPTDHQSAHHAIELLHRTGQHRDALARLDQLPAEAFNPDTTESYILLADALDAPTSLHRALQLKLTHAPNVPDYLRLAEIARTIDNADAALQALRTAIAQLPHAPILRTQFAAILLQEERYDEALTAALDPIAITDPDAKLIALAAAIHTDRSASLLQALGPDFATQPLAHNTRLDLAVAHALAGNPQRASQLFAQVPTTPERYARIAHAQLLARDYPEAARLAQLNLDHKPHPQATDWILLGDIRNKQGQPDDAQAAFANAIRAVTARVLGVTAAVGERNKE